MKLDLRIWALLAGLVLGACKGGDGPKAGPGPGSGPPGPGGGGKPGGMGGPPMAFAVETQPVRAETVDFATAAVGTVEAFERVMITARVAGAVDRVRFREGEIVQAGQVLAEIETDRYALAVRAARAQLDRAKADEADARAGLERREAAEKANPGLIKGEEVETWRARLEAARAAVALAVVQVDQALLNQRDAQVRAPMEGTVQTRDVRTGQYAQPGTLVATLLRKEPLLLRFSIPEPDAASLVNGAVVFFTVAGTGGRHEAHVTHVSAAADATSRMVQVVAEIPKPGELRPGAFAEISVPLGAPREAPVVTQAAVRPSERGFLAYVAEGDKARERVLVLGQRTADGKVEVREGLAVGEQLIVRGAEALREGASIRLVAPSAPAAPSSGAAR